MGVLNVSQVCPKCGLGVQPGAFACPADGTLLEVMNLEPTVQTDPLLGTYLGEYLVQEKLGQGGMGVVYKGTQPLIGKPVAIKILRPEVADNPRQMERLLAEARAANAMQHRGIIDIFSFGVLPDRRQYLVMEYLTGESMEGWIRQNAPIAPQEAVPVLQEVLSALGAAHSAGVVHRDLKPSNVFLCHEDGGNQFVKLLDFGLAKRTESTSGLAAQTRQSIVVGTPEYMAPEQARGESVSPQTDLYAFGLIAFQMLTGRLPFRADSPVQYLLAQVNEPAPRATTLVPTLPRELDDLVLRLLEKDPAKRPSSAGAVRNDLGRIRKKLPRSSGTGVSRTFGSGGVVIGVRPGVVAALVCGTAIVAAGAGVALGRWTVEAAQTLPPPVRPVAAGPSAPTAQTEAPRPQDLPEPAKAAATPPPTAPPETPLASKVEPSRAVVAARHEPAVAVLPPEPVRPPEVPPAAPSVSRGELLARLEKVRQKVSLLDEEERDIPEAHAAKLRKKLLGSLSQADLAELQSALAELERSVSESTR